MFQTVRLTMEIPQFVFDKMIDVLCEETAEIPQLQLVEAWTMLLHARCVQGQVPQVQFLRGGGRRCAHAAMRSSCRS